MREVLPVLVSRLRELVSGSETKASNLGDILRISTRAIEALSWIVASQEVAIKELQARVAAFEDPLGH